MLTLGKFLSINYEPGIPDVDDIKNISGKLTISNLIDSWRKGQSHLKNLWHNQYLQTLPERRAYRLKTIKGEVSGKLKVGEIVIIKDDLPRGRWKGKSLIESEIDKIHRAAII